MMTLHKSEKFHTLRYSQHPSHSGCLLVKKQGIYFMKNLSERLKTVAEAEIALLLLKDVTKKTHCTFTILDLLFKPSEQTWIFSFGSSL